MIKCLPIMKFLRLSSWLKLQLNGKKRWRLPMRRGKTFSNLKLQWELWTFFNIRRTFQTQNSHHITCFFVPFSHIILRYHYHHLYLQYHDGALKNRKRKKNQYSESKSTLNSLFSLLFCYLSSFSSSSSYIFFSFFFLLSSTLLFLLHLLYLHEPLNFFSFFMINSKSFSGQIY